MKESALELEQGIKKPEGALESLNEEEQSFFAKM